MFGHAQSQVVQSGAAGGRASVLRRTVQTLQQAALKGIREPGPFLLTKPILWLKNPLLRLDNEILWHKNPLLGLDNEIQESVPPPECNSFASY